MRPFIPKTDDLSQISRDLRFHPSTVTNPQDAGRRQARLLGPVNPRRPADDQEQR